MISFQVIIIQGEYNDKKFKEKFLSFGEFNFEEQVEKIKKKLNVKYRESLISSRIISTKKDENIKVIDFKNENISNENISKVQSFFEGDLSFLFDLNLSSQIDTEKISLPTGFNINNQNIGLKYIQEVENWWDERGDGRPDIEYDEITFFEGNISFFSFTFNSN